MDEPRACYTEWRGKQIPSINAYIWNLEKWSWWTYLQGRNRRRHRKQTCAHSGEKRGWDELREWHWNIYITICKIASGKLLYNKGSSTGCSVTTYRVGWGGWWEGGSRGKGRMHAYGWFMLLYGRNQYNIVKQLSSSLKKNQIELKKKKRNVSFSR